MAETVSYENEVALLGSVMRDPAEFEALADVVQATDFGWECYSWAWLSMKSLFERGMSIDAVTVGDELMRDGKLGDFQFRNDGTIFTGRNALAKLREGGNPFSVWSYAEKVLDYSAKRQLESLSVKWTDWSKNGRTANQIMADMVKQIGTVRVFNSKAFEHTQTLSEALSVAYDHTDRATRGEIEFVTTGFKDLDKLFAGGMTSPDLYIIAGRPGMGKTAFAVSVARNAAKKGKKVALFSLEMDNTQIAMRLIAQESGVSYDKQKNGQLLESDWPKFTNAIDSLAETCSITLNDLPAISVSKIRQELRRIKDMGGVDFVIIDYIQLAGVDGKYDRRDQEIGELTRGLKSIAKEFGIPVLAAAQLSRDVEKRADKKAILSDLRESGSIENDADVVMFINRPKPEDNDTEIIVAKHRNGATGKVDLIYNSLLTRFESATKTTFSFEGAR